MGQSVSLRDSQTDSVRMREYSVIHSAREFARNKNFHRYSMPILFAVEEAAEVYIYGSEHGPYLKLNHIAGLQRATDYIWVLLQGWSYRPTSSPDYPTVYRAVSEVLGIEYVVGDEHTWTSLSSCTTQLAAFDGIVSRDGTRTNAEFYIRFTTKGGPPISYPFDCAFEMEIVLPQDIRFRVLGIDHESRGQFTNFIRATERKYLLKHLLPEVDSS